MGDKLVMEASAALGLDHHTRVIVQKVAELLRTGYCADLTIRCSDGAELRAHRVIVCRRSSVIAAACDGGFEVSRPALDLHPLSAKDGFCLSAATAWHFPPHTLTSFIHRCRRAVAPVGRGTMRALDLPDYGTES